MRLQDGGIYREVIFDKTTQGSKRLCDFLYCQAEEVNVVHDKVERRGIVSG